MQKEIWKPVVGYDGRYEVSNTGKIRTNLRINKRILSPAYRENYGHVFVNITVNGIRKKKYIHTAVLEAFVCKRPVGMEVRHLDGNPQNNNVDNLAWGTHKENMQDSIRHGTFNFISRPGINHLKSKFNERQIIEIRTHIKEGIKTNVEIGKMYGVHNSTISKIRTGAHWKTNK